VTVPRVSKYACHAVVVGFGSPVRFAAGNNETRSTQRGKVRGRVGVAYVRVRFTDFSALTRTRLNRIATAAGHNNIFQDKVQVSFFCNKHTWRSACAGRSSSRNGSWSLGGLIQIPCNLSRPFEHGVGWWDHALRVEKVSVVGHLKEESWKEAN
jgi:hypothetical protein